MTMASVSRIFSICLLFSVLLMALDCRSDETASVAENARTSNAHKPLVIVITPSRSEQSSFDLPVSIDRIDQSTIQNNAAKVNLSEPLIRVPGVVAQNRQNYAQDLQISVRGFGARSSFGVRGVRLYADGIPATMPDGQGQTSHFDLGSADRIEVLRGPFPALYGNSSGGVIALFTEDAQPGFTLAPFAQLGSYGTSNLGLKAAGEQAAINYVANVSRFDTDGYRAHSAATRDTANAKLRMPLDTDAAVTLIANAVSMKNIQDPLGLARAQFEADPRSVQPNAIAFNTRKSVSQQQLGLKYDKKLNSDDSVYAMLYAGDRSTVQYQAIPVSAQTAPTSSGGVIDLSRQYSGADIRWAHRANINSGTLQWTTGINYDNLNEDRRGYENFVGTTLGVQGNLRRNENNNVHNFDQYLQAQWEPNARWLLLAGVRRSHVSVRSQDHYIVTGNGDDSGGIRYHRWSPVLGVTFKSSDSVHFYASYGEGFETPTLNELSYRAGAAAASGFNFGLKPSHSENYETGVKTLINENWRANLAVFHIDTKQEITVLSNSGGRSVFQNAGKTRRDGAELALAGAWTNGVGALISYSWLRALYAESFCSGACAATTQVPVGNRIPGVPSQTFYGELSWRERALGFISTLEGKYASKIYVDDVNSDAAPAYFVMNLRAGFEQISRSWRWQEFLRVDNLGDRRYAGSVIVNEGNLRFFESAPGRNYLAGISASYSW
ncbi:MAG: TonB-dependent receptor [Gammaproteobacteria bacterium]|nr:TonB-dependent receptor [Gammaproteobacteria bacterium]